MCGFMYIFCVSDPEAQFVGLSGKSLVQNCECFQQSSGFLSQCYKKKKKSQNLLLNEAAPQQSV